MTRVVRGEDVTPVNALEDSNPLRRIATAVVEDREHHHSSIKHRISLIRLVAVSVSRNNKLLASTCAQSCEESVSPLGSARFRFAPVRSALERYALAVGKIASVAARAEAESSVRSLRI